MRAKCFVHSKEYDRQSLNALNRHIDDAMNSRGYSLVGIDARDLIFGNVYSTMTFHTPPVGVGKRSWWSRLRKSDAKALDEQYFKTLRGRTDGVPFRFLFKIGYASLSEGSKGFLITLESEPAIVSKIRQTHRKDDVDEVQYNNIVWENQQSLSEIIHSLIHILGGKVLEEPAPLRHREKFGPPPIIEPEFFGRIPGDVADCLDEANRCFVSQCYQASSVMIRKAIEVAATKKLLQSQYGDKLRDADGYEIGLGRKLDLLPGVAPKIGKSLDQIKLVKWLGDVSAHDSRTQITSTDLQSLAPFIRSFLTNLELKA